VAVLRRSGQKRLDGVPILNNMMDPAIKIAMAICVLVAGFCTSMLFRRDAPRNHAQAPAAEPAPVIGVRPAAAEPAGRPRAVVAVAAPAAAALPGGREEPPPPLAPDYPRSDRPATSRWGPSMDRMLPAAATASQLPRSHTVVDGDTLESLAQRYLGSASRAREIFDANRGLLSDPMLLPIGAELKIPAK
jgi:nucleoid-associated protein YgaU